MIYTERWSRPASLPAYGGRFDALGSRDIRTPPAVPLQPDRPHRWLLRLDPAAPHPDCAGEEPSPCVAGLQIARQRIKLLLGRVTSCQGGVKDARSQESSELSPRGTDLGDDLNVDPDKSGANQQAPQLSTDPWILEVGEAATEYPFGHADVGGVQRIHLMVDVDTDDLSAGPQHADHLAQSSRRVLYVEKQLDAAGDVERVIGKIEATDVANDELGLAAAGGGAPAGSGDHGLAGVHPHYPATRRYEFLEVEGVGARTATRIEYCLAWPQTEAGEACPPLVSEQLGLTIQKRHVLVGGGESRPLRRLLTHFHIPFMN